MTIAAILSGHTAGVMTLALQATVADAVALLAGQRIGAVPVMDGDAVAGIFSERDAVRVLAERGSAAMELGVATVMTTPAVTTTRDQSVIGVLSLMTNRRIRHLPVVEEGRLLGFVSSR